jgi:PAS domain S-box-containing protein
MVVDVNLTAAKLLGIERKQLINRRFERFVEDGFKDQWYRHFLHAKQNPGTSGCELPLRHENGIIKYVHIDCLNVHSNGAAPQLRVTLTDVTERKRSETELRIAAVAFETEEGIIVGNADRTIIRVNKAFTRITGYSSEDVIGQQMVIFRPGRHDEEHFKVRWACVETDGYWQGEVLEKRKNGEPFPMWLTMTAVYDADRRITHYLTSFTDITQIKLAEKVLLDARERLESQFVTTKEELEKTKAETTEINTALNVLLKHRETDKTEAQLSLSYELEATVVPLLKKLKGISSNVQTLRIIDMLDANLQHIMKSYGRASHIDAAYHKLSPIETQVAAMVKLGQPTKVIASTLSITAGTANIHRKHIRKKLGLDSKINLQHYLQSLSD